MYFQPNHGLHLSTMSTKVTQRESDVRSRIKPMVYTYVWTYRSTIYTLYCSHLPSDHGLGPALWVCPCMAGVGQGLDWGPPIGANGTPVVHKAIFMSMENDLLMILKTSDNYHQTNHLTIWYQLQTQTKISPWQCITSCTSANIKLLNYSDEWNIASVCDKKNISANKTKYLNLQSLNADLTWLFWVTLTARSYYRCVRKYLLVILVL